MPSSLQIRLGVTFNDEPRVRVMAGSARWPGGGFDAATGEVPAGRFGSLISDVRSVTVHVTVGWPARLKAEEFVTQYIGPPANAAVRPQAGIGTQYFIAGDGTVVGLIDMPRMTWHGNHMNGWSIGVETGCLEYSATPPANRWLSVAVNADENNNDIPGAKLWLSRHAFFNEIVTSWWTTDTYAGIVRDPLNPRRRMLFSESQYRAWALLGRFLCEQHELPRNFPLLPHALRNTAVDDAATWRRLLLADERFSVFARALAADGITEALFEPAQTVALQARYATGIVARNNATLTARHNRIWTALFDTFRGFHGHGFSGSNTLKRRVNPDTGAVSFVETDHDCAGPLFDWHRFAREVWDWWWYPFDLTANLANVVRTLRAERSATGNTPIREYYFEALNFQAKEDMYAFRTLGDGTRRTNGIFGDISSPSTFNFDDPDVPVYAPANGELVAARFPDTGNGVNMGFVLLRHEVFHAPDLLEMEIDGVAARAHPGRIDYDQEPAYVYSLVIHLARPPNIDFDQPSTNNPDWLNRVLIRKKEADLGTGLYDRDPTHGNMPDAAWNSVPPGSVVRPTVLQGWRADVIELHYFMDALRNGRIALGVSGANHAMPIRVLLGDFLGHGGIIRREGATVLHGIGFEVFASGFVPPTFNSQNSVNGWQLHPSVPPNPPPAIFYQSEWAKVPDAAERARLQGIGVNPDLVPWWNTVAALTQLHPTLPGHGRLNLVGFAFHVEPLKFMRWINETTWASEWPKYNVTDAAGSSVPQAPGHLRPRSRII